MHRLGVVSAALLVGLVLCSASSAHGQRATERFIPIGESPGVSGKLTMIGTIAAVEPERRRIRIAGPGGPVTLAITKSTEIWLDRHELGQSAAHGSLADCQIGRTVEAKYTDPSKRDVAEWVKVRVPAPGAPAP
ncbi:MAG: hypothetical protein E6J87_21855 [Deltaproteobacteria bacterium]|nr:MAG: hypothetical protein E6J87_21855 [Deltaproteobacteria bacterium]